MNLMEMVTIFEFQNSPNYLLLIHTQSFIWVNSNNWQSGDLISRIGKNPQCQWLVGTGNNGQIRSHVWSNHGLNMRDSSNYFQHKIGIMCYKPGMATNYLCISMGYWITV